MRLHGERFLQADFRENGLNMNSVTDRNTGAEETAYSVNCNDVEESSSPIKRKTDAGHGEIFNVGIDTEDQENSS